MWFSGSAQEEVEVVFDPRRSVVLTLTADFRLVIGDVWMAGRKGDGVKRGWTLRFPRVAPAPQGIRLTSLGGSDKPWYVCVRACVCMCVRAYVREREGA